MKKPIRSWAIAASLLALSPSSYAHWGPASPWTLPFETRYCEHDHDGFDWRRVRLKVLVTTSQFCAEWGCDVFTFHDAEVKNVTGNNAFKADIFLVGVDSSIPAGGFPYFAAYQNVENNGKRLLSTAMGVFAFNNLRAYCHSADQSQF